jgi:hypothetical protein
MMAIQPIRPACVYIIRKTIFAIFSLEIWRSFLVLKCLDLNILANFNVKTTGLL